MSTKDARKNKNAQFGKQQDILPLPHISAKTLFEDKREAEKWYTLLYQRRIAITNLIKNTAASMYTKDCKRDGHLVRLYKGVCKSCSIDYVIYI